jgi:hypothetical protein
MRIALWLGAVLCAATAAVAQETIEWSSERRLTRSDFQGRVPVNAASASLSWLNIDASWECRAGELVATVRATFDPSRSWWRSASANIWEGVGGGTGGVSRTHMDARRGVVQRDMQLLEHEQLHFDLAEVAARRIRNRFDELKGACAGPGTTEAFQEAVAQFDRDLQAEQSTYDRETNHGTRVREQDQWRRRIRQQLDQHSRPQTTEQRPRR